MSAKVLRQAAALTVCANARDASDLGLLLGVLGLVGSDAAVAS